jgi:hypothetical protein
MLTTLIFYVWLPRSALSAVRDAASSASYYLAAPRRPDCTSTSCRWVREHPYSVVSSVATSSDRDVRSTIDDDTSVSGSYHLPWAASDGHSDVVIAAVSTHHRTSCLWDASSHYATQSADVLSSSKLHYTADTGFGSGGSLPSSCHRANIYRARLRPRASGSRGHSGTGTSTAPPPPPPRGSSPAWSGLCDDSDEDDASCFSVEPSKAISTSPSDPSPSPQ